MPVSEFSALLRTYREQRRLSQRGLAQATRINQAIISRLESGERGPSSPEQVLTIARALDLDRPRTDSLLSGAGYWPTVYTLLGPRDETLHAVAEVLADERIPETRKRRFRQLLTLLCEEWSTP